MFNKLNGSKALIAAAIAALAAAATSVQAAVPTEVTTALTEGKTDTLQVAGAALIIIIAVAVFKYMRRGV